MRRVAVVLLAASAIATVTKSLFNPKRTALAPSADTTFLWKYPCRDASPHARVGAKLS